MKRARKSPSVGPSAGTGGSKAYALRPLNAVTDGGLLLNKPNMFLPSDGVVVLVDAGSIDGVIIKARW